MRNFTILMNWHLFSIHRFFSYSRSNLKSNYDHVDGFSLFSSASFIEWLT